jgi:hypothetical protein
VTYIQQKFCGTDDKCHQRAASILSADSVDINYDSISHALTMSGFWSQAPGGQGWTETIGKHEGGTDKVEVGLLGAEHANEPEEIKVGGLLAVVGQDEELSMSSTSSSELAATNLWFKNLRCSRSPHDIIRSMKRQRTRSRFRLQLVCILR